MATVQQLEKLYHVRRLFHVEDSLEAAVAGERVKNMIEKTEQLIRQRAFLREERRYLRTTAEALDEYKQGVDSLKGDTWIPKELTTLPSRCIQINVGGLVSIQSLFTYRFCPCCCCSRLLSLSLFKPRLTSLPFPPSLPTSLTRFFCLSFLSLLCCPHTDV